MSPSRKRTKGAKTRRTKEQILQELEVTQRLLIEKEEELVLCQEELAHILQEKNELADIKSTSGNPPDSTREALEIEVNQLKTSAIQNEELLTQAQNRIHELTALLQEKTDLIEKLGPGQEKEQLATSTIQIMTSDKTPQALETPKPLPNTALHKASSKNPDNAPSDSTHQKVYNVPIKISPFTELVKQNKPFSAWIAIDMQNLAETRTSGLQCKTRLFAKRLSDGWTGIIGERELDYNGQQSMTAKLNDIVLPEGMYYLQAVASFSSQGKPMPVAAIHEGEILQVVA